MIRESRFEDGASGPALSGAAHVAGTFDAKATGLLFLRDSIVPACAATGTLPGRKVNPMEGPVRLLLPEGGFSTIDRLLAPTGENDSTREGRPLES